LTASGRSQAPARPRVAVVVATRNRRRSLLRTLSELGALDERPELVVVDNASTDGTPATVRREFPAAKVIPLTENVGAFARTIGARAVDQPYVAFSDDDSWWRPGALTLAAAIFDGCPALAVIAAHVLVGAAERDDPTTLAMAKSPLAARADLPGPPVLGFLACGSVVRRDAFLDVGGFRERLIGFEETLLAVDLVRAGWQLAYVADVIAHHHPARGRENTERRRSQARNALWFAWLHRPASVALSRTIGLCSSALSDPAVRRAFVDVAREAGRLFRERRVVEPETEAALQRIGL
jgi:GT2 family glycosyltransferase